MMELWVTQTMAHDIDLTGDVLRHKWQAFAEQLGIPSEDQLSVQLIGV